MASKKNKNCTIFWVERNAPIIVPSKASKPTANSRIPKLSADPEYAKAKKESKAASHAIHRESPKPCRENSVSIPSKENHFQAIVPCPPIAINALAKTRGNAVHKRPILKEALASLPEDASIRQEQTKGTINKSKTNIFKYLYKPHAQAVGFEIHGSEYRKFH
jgi:hypothetical protein